MKPDTTPAPMSRTGKLVLLTIKAVAGVVGFFAGLETAGMVLRAAGSSPMHNEVSAMLALGTGVLSAAKCVSAIR